ncbi:MAG TPA: hypothetical protein VL997_08630 [Dyella sp.]|nr:hypothetical protein [Dyella sp.]
MSWRTPSSLKWLISKRSRISGALLKIEAERIKLRDRLHALDLRAEVLHAHLSALDQTFGLHEISMDPKIVRPIRPHARRRLLPYGQTGRVILQELRSDGGWLSTTEVVVRVFNHFPNIDTSDYDVTRLCIRKRLGKLSRNGLVERHNASVSASGTHDGKSEMYWRLAVMHEAHNPD